MTTIYSPYPLAVRRERENLVAAYALTGALAEAVPAFIVQDCDSVTLRFVFTPGANSANLLVQVQQSSQPAGILPAAVTEWEGVNILDGASFAAGQIDAYGEVWQYQPAPAVATAQNMRVNTSGATWLRVLAADNGAGPVRGTLAVYWTAVVG